MPHTTSIYIYIYLYINVFEFTSKSAEPQAEETRLEPIVLCRTYADATSHTNESHTNESLHTHTT